MKTFKSLPELLSYFKDNETCIAYLEEQRWNGNVTCPHCNHDKVYRTTRGFKCANKTCYKKFSVTVGTVMESSKISLVNWIAAIYVATAHKKGISSCQLSRDLGITQKTAWFMLHRIREVASENQTEQITKVVQLDEVYLGGKNEFKHMDKKTKGGQGRSLKDKTPIFGMISEGKVNTFVVPDTTKETLKPIIEQMIKNRTIVVTDGYNSYSFLKENYRHNVIPHHLDEYSIQGFHTNSIEGYWSLLKRGIYGIYHSASPKHLMRYCDEFSFRYNTRKLTDCERFNLTLTRMEGRLTHKQLIAR